MRARHGLLGLVLAALLVAGVACSGVDSPGETPTGAETPATATTPEDAPGDSPRAGDSTSLAGEERGRLTTEELVRLAEPSIVRIEAGGAVGTGFVVDTGGYIITNHHVVERAILQPSLDIMVTLYDGAEVTAELIGADERSDLALLRISASDLVALPIADADDVSVGEDVVAIGFPLDLPLGEGGSFTVTRGIVSAKNRVISGGILGAIQTDAAINHGNSGGPLLNMYGEVVGVNTAIAINQSIGTPASGIGFAVGADTIDAVYGELRENGQVERALLGISAFEAVRPAKARELGMPESTGGILVGHVTPAGPVGRAGLQVGDVIVGIDRFDIGNETDLVVALIVLDPGDIVPLEIYRDGERMTLEVTLGDAADQ